MKPNRTALKSCASLHVRPIWEDAGKGCELDIQEGCELDEREGCDLDEREGECGNGSVDDEPSLGSLDGQLNQTKWGQSDFTPKGCHVWTDAEYDAAEFENDELDKGEGPEDTGIGDLSGLAEQTGICLGSFTHIE